MENAEKKQFVTDLREITKNSRNSLKRFCLQKILHLK